MNYRTINCAIVCCALLFVTLPTQGQAKVAVLESISPSVISDITPPDEFDEETRSEENYQVFWLNTAIGEEYAAQFSFDETPLMVFVTGGAMTLEKNWTVDEEAKTGVVEFTARKIQQVDSEVENSFDEGTTLTQVAFIWESESGDGPDETTRGGWLASDFQEWSLIMPTSDELTIGATVRGDAGDAGMFRMFLPPATLEYMAQEDEHHEEEGFDAGELSVFIDGDQVDKLVRNSDGGAYVSFETEIPEEESESNDGGNTDIIDCDGDGEQDEGVDEDDFAEGEDPCADAESEAVVTSSDTGSTSLAVGPRPPLSLYIDSTKVKKGKNVRMKGWIKTAKSGQKVMLLRKFLSGAGSESFAVVKTKRTNAKGKYTFTLRAKRSMRLKVQWKDEVSDSVRVTTKKKTS